MSNDPSITSEVLMAIGRVEGRVEQFFAHQSRQDERLNNHGERIVNLEKWQSRALGYLAGGGLVLATIWAAASAAIEHFKIGS